MEPVMTRLNGWQRIGVVASALWIGSVTIYAFKEISDGPFGTRFLTNIVISATREPDSVLKDNIFRDLVPVDATLDLTKLCTVALVPIAALWLGGGPSLGLKKVSGGRIALPRHRVSALHSAGGCYSSFLHSRPNLR